MTHIFVETPGMWARKRATGRVEHFWYNPHPGQTDVWQAKCIHYVSSGGDSRPPIKVRKADHDQFFVVHPSGAQRCKTCQQVIDTEYYHANLKAQEGTP